MSMLAEPRSRQKWSHDPRNTNWSNDKTKFGYQMLTKMGWNEGGGLGANLTGTTSHVKVNKRGSNAGVGLKESHDDDWIAHQDDFNNLLSALNGKPAGGGDAATSVENKMKASKHRYTKFVKSKDLSNASSDDLACIFGQRGKNTVTPTTDARDDEEEGSSGESSSDEHVVGDIKTIESTLSMNEYFAKKMAAIKQKQSVSHCTNGVVEKQVDKYSEDESPLSSLTLNSEEVRGDSTVSKVKKKKKKAENEVYTGDETPCAVAVGCEENNEIISGKKKKKKKLKENAETVSENTPEDSKHLPPQPLCTDETESIPIVKKKKKKKKALVAEETEYEHPAEVTVAPVVVCSEGADVVLENGLVKKKKKKRKHIDEESSQPLQDNNSNNVQTDADVVKKKKKKKKSAEIL